MITRTTPTPYTRYVLVDEFQDVSTPQFSFLKALIGPENGSVTAVGDDDQSIYSFQVGV
jgi:DNA helicase-2/ATP-dependent DNA helicase PcrA